MQIINACGEIDQYFENKIFDLSIWRRYAASISPLLPQLCEADIVNYDFDKMVLPVLQEALSQPEKLAKIDRSFRTIVDSMAVTLPLLFGENEDFTLILYLGLCNAAGRNGRRAFKIFSGTGAAIRAAPMWAIS